MANKNLLTTDFLPSSFKYEIVDSDFAQPHFLAFHYCLEAHNIAQPADNTACCILRIFKRTLESQVRLRIEGKKFQSLQELWTRFRARFSPSSSRFARSKEPAQKFQALRYTAGETAEVYSAKITTAVQTLPYNEDQIRDKFRSSVPNQYRSAVLMTAPMDAPLPILVDKTQCYFDLQANQNFTSSAIPSDIMATQGTQEPCAQLHSLMKALESKLTKPIQDHENVRWSRPAGTENSVVDMQQETGANQSFI